MSKSVKFVRVNTGKGDEFVLVKTIKPNSLNIDEPLTCPVCKAEVEVAMEVMQYGFWKDSFTMLLVCQECAIAYWYSFTCEYDKGAEAHE